jgi:hypothetical protein
VQQQEQRSSSCSVSSTYGPAPLSMRCKHTQHKWYVMLLKWLQRYGTKEDAAHYLCELC